MIHKCGKDVAECDCPDSEERLRWLLSKDSPVVLGGDYAFRILRKLTELEEKRLGRVPTEEEQN